MPFGGGFVNRLLKSQYGKCDMNLLSQDCMTTETQTFIKNIYIKNSYSHKEAKDDNDTFKNIT